MSNLDKEYKNAYQETFMTPVIEEKPKKTIVENTIDEGQKPKLTKVGNLTVYIDYDNSDAIIEDKKNNVSIIVKQELLKELVQALREVDKKLEG